MKKLTQFESSKLYGGKNISIRFAKILEDGLSIAIQYILNILFFNLRNLHEKTSYYAKQ